MSTVASALSLARPRGGEEHSRQNRDNGDDNQQLDEGKSEPLPEKRVWATGSLHKQRVWTLGT